jgi:hypothetical protein
MNELKPFEGQERGGGSGVEEHAPVAQPVEHRQAIIVASYGHATYQARDSPERERGARDEWEARGPVVPVAGEKPHARRVAAHQHPEAVVLDLVQPEWRARAAPFLAKPNHVIIVSARLG